MGEMKKKFLKKIGVIFALVSLLTLSSCFTFISITQPNSAMTGEQISSRLLIRTEPDPFWQLDKSAHYAIIGLLIPTDWSVDSVYYEPGDPGDIGPNQCAYLPPDSSDAEPGGQVDYWTDSLNVHFPPPEGMHWVVYQSLSKDSTKLDTGYVNLFIKMTVGHTSGTFNIGYFVSDAALDFSQENWYTVNLDNPIEVLKNQPPKIDSLTAVQLTEDTPVFFPFKSWYAFVLDETPDSLLDYSMLPGKHLTVVKNDSGFIITPSENWFGTDTLQLIVTDPNSLADTASFCAMVIAVNDTPSIDLPQKISFRNDSTYSLNLWSYATDVEDADSLLSFLFGSDSDSLFWEFNSRLGKLELSAPNFNGECHFFIKVIDSEGASASDTVLIKIEPATGMAFSNGELPAKYELLQNFPNPFNSTTSIHFALKKAGMVKIEIYNNLGQKVSTLLNSKKNAGYHQVFFHGKNFPSGVYFYEIKTNDFRQVKKMLLLK